MRSGKASTSTAPIFYGSNEKEEKLLLQFAESGRKEGVQELINRGVRMRIDYVGNSALHLAAQNGFYEICDILLKAGYNQNAQNRVGRTPLQLAVANGHLLCVNALLRSGFIVNAKDHIGHTALHWAVSKDYPHLVKRLMKYGADPNIVSKFGETPLTLAHQNGFDDMVENMTLYVGEASICQQEQHEAIQSIREGIAESSEVDVDVDVDVDADDDCDMYDSCASTSSDVRSGSHHRFAHSTSTTSSMSPEYGLYSPAILKRPHQSVQSKNSLGLTNSVGLAVFDGDKFGKKTIDKTIMGKNRPAILRSNPIKPPTLHKFDQARAGLKMATAAMVSNQAAEIMDLPVGMDKQPSMHEKLENALIQQYQAMPMKPLTLKKYDRAGVCPKPVGMATKPALAHHSNESAKSKLVLKKVHFIGPATAKKAMAPQVNDLQDTSNVPVQMNSNGHSRMVQIPFDEILNMKKQLAELTSRLQKFEERR